MKPNQTADFWLRVRCGSSDECWPWTKGCDGKGYGAFHWHGKQVGAHRMAYRLAVGSIPDGLWVLHRCDNPPCCNPAHLFVGTPSDNTVDMWNKGRQGAHVMPGANGSWMRARTHCPKNHEYTPENTYTYPDGRRKCRACEAARAAEAQKTEKRRAQKREAQRRYRLAHPDRIRQMRQDYQERKQATAA